MRCLKSSVDVFVGTFQTSDCPLSLDSETIARKLYQNQRYLRAPVISSPPSTTVSLFPSALPFIVERSQRVEFRCLLVLILIVGQGAYRHSLTKSRQIHLD